jgi:hypothetical protein
MSGDVHPSEWINLFASDWRFAKCVVDGHWQVVYWIRERMELVSALPMIG